MIIIKIRKLSRESQAMCHGGDRFNTKFKKANKEGREEKRREGGKERVRRERERKKREKERKP